MWLFSSRITSGSLESPSGPEANPEGRYYSTGSEQDPVVDREGSPVWGRSPFQLTASSDEDIIDLKWWVGIEFPIFSFLMEVYTLQPVLTAFLDKMWLLAHPWSTGPNLLHTWPVWVSPMSGAIFLDLCFFLFGNHQSPCNKGGRFHRGFRLKLWINQKCSFLCTATFSYFIYLDGKIIFSLWF